MAPPRPWREVARGYDDAAAGYDDRHDDRRARARNRRIDGILIDATAGARAVLELGAGTGRLLTQVHAPVRVGLDVSAAMLAVAGRRGLDVVRGDAHHLPFPAASFDAVLAGKGVFRYLDAPAALAEACRVLRPGGRLALHQYGARTFTRRGARQPDPRVHELAAVDEMLGPAREIGLRALEIRRFRSLRWRPYVTEIAGWIDRHSPVQLWDHVVFVLAR